MKRGKTFLFAFALLVSAVLADHHEGDHACEMDSTEATSMGKFLFSYKELGTCFKQYISEDDVDEFKAPPGPTLPKFQNFFKKFCTHDETVRSCLAELNGHYSHCKNKKFITTIKVVTDIVQHLIHTGCEDNGNRLAHLAKMLLFFFVVTDTVPESNRCMHHAFTMLGLTNEVDLDLTSDTYFLYKELPKFQKCKEHIEGDENKEVFQWALDEFTHKLKCHHPDEDSLMLCSEIDVSKVPVTDICTVPPVKKEHLYDHLESMISHGCYKPYFNHDVAAPDSINTSVERLKEVYHQFCKDVQLPACLVEASAYGEECLTEDENKHFHWEVDSAEAYTRMMCVENGDFLAEFMHEVYKHSPEHGNALKVCYQALVDHPNTEAYHVNAAPDMKYYHNNLAFKDCVVEKLHDNPDIAKRYNDGYTEVLRTTKCVNPADGNVVFCESIHHPH